MKARIKSAIKNLLLSVPVAAAPGTRILTYHSIGPRRHDMTVSTEAFAAQMAWLGENARVISLDAAVAGEPGVALTFDDGFVDNLRNAAPVLARHAFPATVFMVAGRAGGYLDGEPDPAQGRLMTWEELREIRAFGVEIGGHTLSHPHLSALTEEEQRQEIFGCKAALEDGLGETITAFAYPYGSALDYTEATRGLAKEAGFNHACSNRYGPHQRGDDIWQVRRIWIDATDTLEPFQGKVAGRLDALRWLDSSAGIRARRWLQR